MSDESPQMNGSNLLEWKTI